GRFVLLAEELAETLEREQIDYVVGDAAEGYDLCHDLCRLLIDAAVAQAGRRRPGLRNYELLLDSPQVEGPPELGRRSLWVRGDEESWRRKPPAAGGHRELAGEIARAGDRLGRESRRVGCLRPAVRGSATRSRSRSARESWADCGNGIRFGSHSLP